MDVMKDFGGSRYKGVKGARRNSFAPWRPEIFSLLLGLTLGICVRRVRICGSNHSPTARYSIVPETSKPLLC